MANSESLPKLVQSFLKAANQHDSEKVLAMFNDGDEFELVGVYRVEGNKPLDTGHLEGQKVLSLLKLLCDP